MTTKNYTWGNQGQQVFIPRDTTINVEEINPLDQKFVNTTVILNGGGSANTRNYYIDMEGFTRLGIHYIITPVSGTTTITLWGSMQNDGTDPSLVNFQNITSAIFGVVSFTSSGAAIDDVGASGVFKHIRIQVVTTGNDTFTIYYKKVF